MSVNYADVSKSIDYIIEEAEKEGFRIYSIAGLHDYLWKNRAKEVKILGSK